MIPQSIEGTGVMRPLKEDMFKYVAAAFNAAKEFSLGPEVTAKDLQYFLGDLLYCCKLEGKTMFQIFFANLSDEHKALFDKLLGDNSEYQKYREEDPNPRWQPYAHYLFDEWFRAGCPGAVNSKHWTVK